MDSWPDDMLWRRFMIPSTGHRVKSEHELDDLVVIDYIQVTIPCITLVRGRIRNIAILSLN